MWSETFTITLMDSWSLPAAGDRSIYRVPDAIRRLKPDDYTPRLISIGPLHRGKSELADMQNKKERYVKYFLERLSKLDEITITVFDEITSFLLDEIGSKKKFDGKEKLDQRVRWKKNRKEKRLEEISTFIENNEQRIRDSYAEISKLNSRDYISMILYDAIFIIEFFLRAQSDDGRDLVLVTGTQAATLRSDLQLAENQLPYFVLEEIYRKYFPMGGSGVPTFEGLCCSFFSEDANFRLDPLARGVKHFTDWRRRTLLNGFPQENPRAWIGDLPCATKLHESGVKFTSVDRECLIQVTFEQRNSCFNIPCCNLLELQIPHFAVNSQTEGLLRNILAFEQCHYPWDTQFSHYILFLDYLIDTEKDVDLLVGEEIITNRLGNNTSVANLFNSVCRMMTIRGNSNYPNICQELREHYNNPWNRAKATLKRVYFHNIWRGTATVAAVILLILTVIGTICSILQVV